MSKPWLCQLERSGTAKLSTPRARRTPRGWRGEGWRHETETAGGGKRYKLCLFSISTGWERQIQLCLAALHLHTQPYPPAPAASRELGFLQGARRIYTQAPLIKRGVAASLQLLWMEAPAPRGVGGDFFQLQLPRFLN